jgi:outer membrane lipoprotein
MKRLPYIILVSLILSSCAPVLRYDLMKTGIRDIRLSEMKENPAQYRGKLLILGGIIINTTVTKEGSLIEAVYVPVDSRGYLKGVRVSDGRFLAIFRGRELLDPVIFREKKEITLAGVFVGTRIGKIGEMEYIYPLFEIEEIYLWGEKREQYYPYWWYDPWWHEFWWYDPWWRYR